MAEFRNIWILSFLAMFCNSLTEANLCKCTLSFCVLMQPNTDFIENVENYCSTLRIAAHDVVIIKIMTTKLSSTLLSEFPNMTYLDIHPGQLARFEKDAFSSAGKLSKLRLIKTNLTNLEDYIFKGADNLKYITIDRNPLKEISEYAFTNLYNLESLDIYRGKLTILPRKLFENNRMLKVISIKENRIRFIDPEMFQGLDALDELDLTDNWLETFDHKFLKASTVILDHNSLHHLVINEHYRTLFARYNYIETITVEGLNVAELSLANNSIRDIGNLTKLVNLATLSLGGNALEPSTVFNKFIALEELMLHSTYISFTSETFENLDKLRTLDLSYNRLTEADFTIFRSQSSLQILSYKGNRINSFNYLEAKQYLPQLQMLSICSNGWNSTYYEQNFARMRQLGISHGHDGTAADYGFNENFVNMCNENEHNKHEDDKSLESFEDADRGRN